MKKDDSVLVMLNEDGVAEVYDDTYDITIHCETEEEQKKVCEILKRCHGWIPVEERLPENHYKLVLVQVSGSPNENISLSDAFELATYNPDDGWILENYPEWEDANPVAWMRLPEPYRMK